MDPEQKRLDMIEAEIKQWWQSPRWENVERTYTPRQVAVLRQTLPQEYAGNAMCKKLYTLLKESQQNGTGNVCWGALDPVQVINEAKYQKCIYVSGWQCSATASTTNEPGPDFADYPANTVPEKVDQLYKAMLLQDRMQNHERSQMTPEQRAKTPRVDYMTPMIADADAGFGGVTSVMKLIKLMIEAGAAGIHIEDQRPGNKKCGHMGGKVIVSTREHVNRIIACRLMADIMGNELIILARTDSLSAKLIDSNIDPIDQPFILGRSYDNKEVTIFEAGLEGINRQFKGADRDRISATWKEKASRMGLKDAINLAKSLGFTFEYDWEVLRTFEGFYQIRGCVELCAARAHQFLRYADMQWMETPSPEVSLAAKFSRLVKEVHPKKFLAYNLSPSFNWSAFKMTDQDIASFTDNLGKLGFVYQFITLAGFHLNALKSEKFAKDLGIRKMMAYVERIQRKEEKHNVDQLTHQKWSGANYVDACLQLVEKESATLATSAESTENQFKKKSNVEVITKH